MNIEIKSTILHHIDFETNQVELVEINKNEARAYINQIIKNSIENVNTRYFKPRSKTTEVISLVKNLVDSQLKMDEANNEEINNEEAATTNLSEHIEVSTSISERLKGKEQEAQQTILALNKEIKKGSLIQSLVKIEDNYAYILAKVEHNDFFDKINLEMRTGLPAEKIILKTCVISFNDTSEIESIKIYDSNPTISKYWYDGLLELEEASSNEDNTQKSYDAIEGVLIRKIKQSSKADYTLLHNSLISYYNQNKGFDYEDMIDKVFNNYEPVNNDKVNIKSIVKVVEKLPEKRNFERRFDIIPKVIRARKRRVISINDNIDLTLKEDIKDLKSTIHAVKDSDDELYLKIKVSEKVFEEFNFDK